MCGRLSAALVTALVFLPRAQAQVDPYQAWLNNAYWGYWHWQNPVADIIDAQGRYLIAEGQARLINEDVKAKKLENRKKEIEFWVWRRNYLLQADEDERKKLKEIQLRRDIDEPAITEIYAGSTMNRLLEELKKTGPATPSIQLEPETLQHINLRSASDHGLTILNKKEIFWGPLLSTSEFADARRRIEGLLAEIRKQLPMSSRGANPETLEQLLEEIAKLLDRVKRGIPEDRGSTDVRWTFDNCVDAKRTLGSLRREAETLQRTPGAAFYLQPLNALTVGELITYMNKAGLYFAEALPGDERHYAALQSAMAAELRKQRPNAAPAP